MAVTISDIAKEANVSLATVSRVLNNSGYVKESTRIKIEEAIKRMNYVPSAIARSLSTNESNTIGVIVPDVTNSYFGKLIKGISEIAEKNNLNIILFNCDNILEKEIKALYVLKEQRIKGIVMTPGFGQQKHNKEYLQVINNLNIPIVLVSADLKFKKLNGIFVDNVQGGFMATDEFIKQGHKKIAIMTGILESEPSIERVIGYKKALKEAGIKINNNYILNGKFSTDAAYRLTEELLNMDYNQRPTALVVCSNRMTIGVVKCIKDNGLKIQKDLSVIAFDKVDILDMLGVKMTYIDECPLELGKKSMELLCNIFNNKINYTARIVIEPKMIKAE